jgi:hypothetical protein
MSTRMVSPARIAISAALAIGFLASAAVIWQSSRAAFYGKTYNDNNAWSAGTVSLTDNDSNGALFSASGLKPGDGGTACIKVTYGGSLAAAVRLYVASGDLTGTLAPYLNITVDRGTNAGSPAFPDCTGFTSDGTTQFSGTLAAFSDLTTGKHDYASGWASWNATTNDVKWYQFTWTLADNNSAQGQSAGVKFTWEAQNT